MPRRKGSAAVTKVAPRSADNAVSPEVLASLLACADAFAILAAALPAAIRSNPGRAALMVVSAGDDLRAHLRTLRSTAEAHLTR